MAKQKIRKRGGRLPAIVIALLGVFLLAGRSAEAKVNVATTIGMVADLVRQVGGGKVEVEQLMGPGVTLISTSRPPRTLPA